MTAPVPSSPGGLEAELAEALERAWRKGTPFVPSPAEGSCTRLDFRLYAAVLLPIVERHAARRAAEELRAAANRWAYGAVARFLRARASALDPTTEETDR